LVHAMWRVTHPYKKIIEPFLFMLFFGKEYLEHTYNVVKRKSLTKTHMYFFPHYL
jgi:hypothetical protein